jgi:hypothetical protein
MKHTIVSLAFVISRLLLLQETESSLLCSHPKVAKAIYGCRFSEYLHITYTDEPLGCGDIYSSMQVSAPPISVTADALSDDGSMYTLLLVDTLSHAIHYGAVNLEYDFVTSTNNRTRAFDPATNATTRRDERGGGGGGGEVLIRDNNKNIDEAEGVFVKYQGPDATKKWLWSTPDTLWPYEWLFARQSAVKDIPAPLKKTSGFNYGEFFQNDVIIYALYFSSGFCAT